MKENKILVSVCMISYNHEKFIKEAIQGVLMQEFDGEVELIIADDNSPDNTKNIVEDCISNNTNKSIKITYIKHEQNKGMMPNFIWSLSQCKGKYIALCEGDDYWTDPYKLQKQVDFLGKNENNILCFHDCEIIDENNEVLEKSKLSKLKITQQNFTSQELKKGPTLPTLTLMFRNVVANMPEYLIDVKNGDTSLISFLGMFGEGTQLLDIEPAAYRIHDGGVWSNIHQKEKYFHRSKTFLLLKKLHKNDLVIKDYFEKRTLKALSFSLVLSLDEKNYKEYFNRFLILSYRSIILLNFKYLKSHLTTVWTAYIYPKIS